MVNPRGFLDFKRVELIKLEPEERIKNYKKFSHLDYLRREKCTNAVNKFLSE